MLALDIVVTGVVLGGIYALVATGLTLQYGVARILNLAYGEFFIASAFGAYWLQDALDMSPLVGLMIIMPLAFALHWVVYQVLLTPLVRRAKNRGALEVDTILFTFGLLFVVQGVMLVLFGGQYYSYGFLATRLEILGAVVPLNRLIAFAVAMTTGLLLFVWLTTTRRGAAVRAVAAAPTSAQLVGIDVRSASALAFAAGGALCAAGGVLISMFFTFTAAMGVVFTMKALVVVIMGGVGNVVGALAAGLLLGLAETSVSRLIDPGLTLAVNFALFVIVLLVRPTGIFGRSA